MLLLIFGAVSNLYEQYTYSSTNAIYWSFHYTAYKASNSECAGKNNGLILSGNIDLSFSITS